MTRRINIVLLVALVASSLVVVALNQRSRMLYFQQDVANTEATQLDNRYDEMLVTQTELAKASLIDPRAREQLGLVERLPQRTMHILLDAETRQQAVEATLRWQGR